MKRLILLYLSLTRLNTQWGTLPTVSDSVVGLKQPESILEAIDQMGDCEGSGCSL